MPPTSAKLTLNNFSKGGEGGAPSECDNQFHDNTERVVALSTGWFSNKARSIIITAVSNGMSVEAKVVTNVIHSMDVMKSMEICRRVRTISLTALWLFGRLCRSTQSLVN
ncbi:hypothetical protein Prudu_016264 [Prunus dulcis]|uniref:Uncharacterized protein n=1 Tax=Prunus dulcis TaxID=3755 RepID=A0A4Y1RLL8_PRUDU|nr:hypothetical protein Prudu_016264 [Prunus dulcis]